MSGAASLRTRLEWPPLIALALVLLIGVVALLPSRPLHDGATVVASRTLRFAATDDGGMRVVDASNGAVVGSIASVEDGFVPGVLHGLEVARRRYGVNTALPYRITQMSDGRVLLGDAPTRTEIDLESFGPDNAARFVGFLHTPEPPAP